jgi:hypothetical protein
MRSSGICLFRFVRSRFLLILRLSTGNLSQMGWANACEVFQREISRILEGRDFIDPGGLGKGMVIGKLRNDMEFLHGLSKRIMNVYPRLSQSFFA